MEMKTKTSSTFKVIYRCSDCGFEGEWKEFKWSKDNNPSKRAMPNESKCPRCKKFRTAMLHHYGDIIFKGLK